MVDVAFADAVVGEVGDLGVLRDAIRHEGCDLGIRRFCEDFELGVLSFEVDRMARELRDDFVLSDRALELPGYRSMIRLQYLRLLEADVEAAEHDTLIFHKLDKSCLRTHN